MKQIFVVFILLICASLAFAQNNTSAVGQTGSDNIGDVTQTAGNNGATITTDGDFNKAIVNQASYNSAIITQSPSTGNGLADPTSAAITQVNNDVASITQSGFREVAWIYQQGYDHGSVIQTGSWNGSGDYFGGNYGYFTVEQHGNQNNGNVKTLHDYNGIALDPLRIFQSGNLNGASISTGWSTSSNHNLGSIDQTGNSNNAAVTQEGGDYNEARISSTGSFNGLPGVPVLIEQMGSHNFGRITETSDNNAATTIQHGNNNTSTVIQN